MNHDALARKAQAGDAAALDKIIRIFQPLGVGAIYQVVKNGPLATDLSWDASAKLWRSISQWRGDCGFSSWVFYIYRCEGLQYLRQAKRLDRYDPLETAMHIKSEVLAPDAAAERDEFQRMTQQIFTMMPDVYREALQMWMVDDLTTIEIAAVLGKSIAATKSALYRARHLFGRALERMEQDKIVYLKDRHHVLLQKWKKMDLRETQRAKRAEQRRTKRRRAA